MIQIAKILFVLGAVFFATGALLILLNKSTGLGHLPGDIVIRRENFTFMFPLTTCIIASLILSVVLWIISRIG